MALDNKSLVSSANYLTDLNSTYSKAIVLAKNNVLIPNGINHTIEATISYFDRTEFIDKVLILKAPVVINSNASMLSELANIVSEISTQIDDSIILNSSHINGNDLVLDISVSTDLTILKTLNIKVKYGSVLKYDLDSTSSEYISILTNAGLNDINVVTNINNIASQILPNLDEILLVDDKASEVSINTGLVSTMKSEVISMRDETIVNRDSSILSAASALDSKNSALASLSSTLESESKAKISEINSKESELNSKDSENASKASELVSVQKANEASASENIATSKATIATTKASEALVSANNANQSEINALSSSVNSENSAIASENSSIESSSSAASALSSKNIAITKANEASVSAAESLASEVISTQKASDSLASSIVSSAKAAEALISANNAHASELSALDSKNIAITKASEALQSASNASESEDIATQKASEALTSANNADVSESNALASELLAEKWASENEDIIVAEGKYSARHYMLKAKEFAQASLNVINDEEVKTIQTYSSSKIENDLNKIGFDLTADVAVSTGQIAWNATEGTYDMGLENGSVLQAGQENIRKVTNNSGALISNGTLVMYNGTNGASGRINVKPFTAGFNEAIKLYGVATQAIADGADGIITIEGKVRGTDTTGASVGEVWEDNDILYAKPNDNGRMTKIEPADNELKIVVASVIKAHHANGTLEIRFMPFNENAYYTKVQNDILLDNKVPIIGDFTLDLGEL